jgi:hypothetical protein
MIAASRRTWTLAMPSRSTLPKPRCWLNSNDRGTWKARLELTRELRKEGEETAEASRVPPLARARIVAVYEPPDWRRHDPANLYATVKVYVDGLRDASVLEDDSAEYLIGPFMVTGYPYVPRNPYEAKLKMARIVLHVTELPPLARIQCVSVKAAAAVVAEARHGFGDPGAPGEYRCRADGKTVIAMYTDLRYLDVLVAWAFANELTGAAEARVA